MNNADAENLADWTALVKDDADAQAWEPTNGYVGLFIGPQPLTPNPPF